MTCVRHPASEGFTLIETLVTLAVLGLAAALLATSVQGRWFTGPEQSAEDGVAAAQRVLRMRLERLAPVVRSDSSDATVDVQGDASQFSFAAPPLGRDAPDALQRFRLMLLPSRELTLFSAPALSEAVDLRDRSLSGWQPHPLLDNVEALELSYFGPDRFTQADRWQAFWLDRPQPPALVRVRVRFAAGDRREWPDLIVRPRATVNLACRIQATSGRCEDF